MQSIRMYFRIYCDLENLIYYFHCFFFVLFFTSVYIDISVNSLTGLALISVEVTRKNLGPKGFIGGHSRTGDAAGRAPAENSLEKRVSRGCQTTLLLEQDVGNYKRVYFFIYFSLRLRNTQLGLYVAH
jgi:hypothetical protein